MVRKQHLLLICQPLAAAVTTLPCLQPAQRRRSRYQLKPLLHRRHLTKCHSSNIGISADAIFFARQLCAAHRVNPGDSVEFRMLANWP
jgi:hypothetical protein